MLAWGNDQTSITVSGGENMSDVVEHPMSAPPTVQPSMILVRPQLGENIGAAARAMANFALDDLRIIAARDGWPSDVARTFASGANHVIDAAKHYDDIDAGVGDFHYLMATTARRRDLVKPVFSPEAAVQELCARLADGQRCGILFGPERTGLDNDEIALADAVVIAPVNPAFASINLAQAALLIGYEWFKATAAPEALGRQTKTDRLGATGLQLRGSRPAEKHEMQGLMAHLERELDDSGFLRPPEKRPTMVRNLRTMFERMEPTEQEVRTLRGVIASLTRTHLRPRK